MAEEPTPSTALAAGPDSQEGDVETDITVGLSSLIKALSEGVLAARSLPTGDEFDFQACFPEFAAALGESRAAALEVLNETFQKLDAFADLTYSDGPCDDFGDPLLWDRCSEVCEVLLEQLSNDDPKVQVINQWSKNARSLSAKSLTQLRERLVDMEKPQVTYQFQPQNSRTEPFIPPISNKPNAVTPLDLSLKPGHGLDTRFPARKQISGQLAEDLVAPTSHVPHVYEAEISQLVFTPWQLKIPETFKIQQSPSPLTADWIDTVENLEKLSQQLEELAGEGHLVVALDLEAHSWRSFSGLVCLMQLSVRIDGEIRNFLVDTLKLRNHMHRLLPITSNPDVVKVMHGADSDVLWLQRDFGLYVVNLFDTGRAARELKFPSASYAHLLFRYVGIVADKTFQLADWRQRPIPPAMLQYAIQDTYYLLDIYDLIKADLATPERIKNVLQDSKLVSLSRYAIEPFNPSGYKPLRSHNTLSKGLSTATGASEEKVLARLWDWRDAVARLEDDSVNFVCDKATLRRIALSAGSCTSLQGLQAISNPLPPLVLKFAQDILRIVKEETVSSAGVVDGRVDSRTPATCVEDSAADDKKSTLGQSFTVSASQKSQPVGAFSSSAFLTLNARSNATSPVLGTEALYLQAGWMTPQERLDAVVDAETTTSAGEDDCAHDPNHKPKRLLTVHTSNQSYRSRKLIDPEQPDPESAVDGPRVANPASHSVPTNHSVDGMETVRVAMDSAKDSSFDEELRMARQSSAQVRKQLTRSLPPVLGLVTPTIDVDEEDVTTEERRDVRIDDGLAQSDEDFVIPRSMREIYKISNRNRRNKKTGSPTPERGVTPTTEKEQEELARAEALLVENGLLPSCYFDDSTSSPGKRPRTKTSSGRESEETVPQESVAAASREEDFRVIKAVGWLPDSATPDGGLQGHASKQVHPFSTTAQTGKYEASKQVPNPFFSGAALEGGILTQGFKVDQRAKKPGSGRGKQQGRRQERPEKKDGKTHTYRKR